MSRSNPWDVSASGPPVASGHVAFYNPAQFRPDHSTGSAVAPPNTFSDAGHGAGIDDMSASANYPFEQAWHNNWNNFGAWPQVQGYNSTGFDGNYYFPQQQQQSGEPAASLSEGATTYHGEQVTDWSANQPYGHYSTQYVNVGAYNYDPTIVGEYDNLIAGKVDSSGVSTSQSGMQGLYTSPPLEDSSGMSPFFNDHGDNINLSGLPPPAPLPKTVLEGVERFSAEELPAVNSFSNINYQPSPFDELGDIKSPRTGLPEQSVVPSSHSRQSSAGGVVQFVIGGSSSVSESQSRTDSPHLVGWEPASGAKEYEQNETKIRTDMSEHAAVTQPHFTDAGSHNKSLTSRADDSPVHSTLPQGTMTGTPASSHQRKLAAGPSTPLEHPPMAPDFAAAALFNTDTIQLLSGSVNSEIVNTETNVSEEFSIAHHVDDSQMLVKAVAASEHQMDMYAGPLGSHPDSSFTPVVGASAKNAAISPEQEFPSLSAAVATMQTGSVCSAAGSDSGALDMREIELDAMVDSGSPQDTIRHVEVDSKVEAVGECRVGSGTFKQNVHDASGRGNVHHQMKAIHEATLSPTAALFQSSEPAVSGTFKQSIHHAGSRSHVHHHVKAQRESTMSPATTLWENPEPAVVRLLPAPAASLESQSMTHRMLTHEIPQNTDAGPSKSGPSSIVHELSLDMYSAMHSADDQRVPQTQLSNSTLSQTSHAACIDHSLPSQSASESSSCQSVIASSIQQTTAPDMSDVVANEPVNLLSEEFASTNVSSVTHCGHTLNSGPLRSSHVAVLQTSEKPISEGVVTVPAGSVLSDKYAPHSSQSMELRTSVGSEAEHTRGMEAHQTPNAIKQNVEHAVVHSQQYDARNSQENVYLAQNENTYIDQGVPYREKIESRGVETSSQKSCSQQMQQQEYDDNMHVMKSKQLSVPNSVSGVPEEWHRMSRYGPEVDRPRSRQDDMDQVSRRASSRQGYDDEHYGRPHSRQDYDDRRYDRPHSRPGYDYVYDQAKSRQMSEDPHGRPRSRQAYEGPYRPRSRQGYDDRRDIPHAEDQWQQRPAYEGRHDRPSSRQSYHGPAERPGSQQQYDYRPRSRTDYEDWPGHAGRNHGGRYSDNRRGHIDSYKKPGSKQEDEGNSSRHANRYPDESFNRSRYNAPDERYDRTSWSSQEDPRYRPSRGYREEEHRRPRSRGGEMHFMLSIQCMYNVHVHLLSKAQFTSTKW